MLTCFLRFPDTVSLPNFIWIFSFQPNITVLSSVILSDTGIWPPSVFSLKMTEDKMVGWHQWLNAHGFGWTPGVGDGQGGLACCGSWGHKESDTTEQPNWTELMFSLAMYYLLGRFSWPGKSHGLRSLADYRLLWVQVHTRVIHDLATKPQQ